MTHHSQAKENLPIQLLKQHSEIMIKGEKSQTISKWRTLRSVTSVICYVLVLCFLSGSIVFAAGCSARSDKSFSLSSTALFYGGLIARSGKDVFFSDVENGGVLCVMREDYPASGTRLLSYTPAVNICVVGNDLYYTDVAGSYYLQEADGQVRVLMLPDDARNVTGLFAFQGLEDRIVWGGKLFCIRDYKQYLKSNRKEPPVSEQIDTSMDGYCYNLYLDKNTLGFTETIVLSDVTNDKINVMSSQMRTASASLPRSRALNTVTCSLRKASYQNKTIALANTQSVIRDAASSVQEYYNQLAESANLTPIHLIAPTPSEIDAKTREARKKEAESWRNYAESVPEGYRYGGVSYTCQGDGTYSYAYYYSTEYGKSPILVELNHSTGEQKINEIKASPKVMDDKLYAIDQQTGALVEYSGESVGKTICSLPVDQFAFANNGDIVVSYTGVEGEAQSALVSKQPYTEESIEEWLDKDIDRGTPVSNSDKSWYTHTTPPEKVLPEYIKDNFVDYADHPYGRSPSSYYEIGYAGGDKINGAHWVKVDVTYDAEGNRIETRTPATQMRVPPAYLNAQSMAEYNNRYQRIIDTLQEEARQAGIPLVPPGYHLEPIDGDWFNGANLVQDEPAVNPSDAASAAIELSRGNTEALAKLYGPDELEKLMQYYNDNMDESLSFMKSLIASKSCLHDSPLVDQIFTVYKQQAEFDVRDYIINGNTAAVEVHIIENADIHKEIADFNARTMEIMVEYTERNNKELFDPESWFPEMSAECMMTAKDRGMVAQDYDITLTMTLSDDNQWVLENPQEALDRVFATDGHVSEAGVNAFGGIHPDSLKENLVGGYTAPNADTLQIDYDAVLGRTLVSGTQNGNGIRFTFYDNESAGGFFDTYYYAEDAKPGEVPLGRVYGTYKDGVLHTAFSYMDGDVGTTYSYMDTTIAEYTRTDDAPANSIAPAQPDATPQPDETPQPEGMPLPVEPQASAAPFTDRTGAASGWDWYDHASCSYDSVPNGRYVSENGRMIFEIDRPFNEESWEYYTWFRLMNVSESGEILADLILSDMSAVSESSKFTLIGGSEEHEIVVMAAREGDILLTFYDGANGGKEVFRNKRFRLSFDRDANADPSLIYGTKEWKARVENGGEE